jgi:hypothetical protein
MPNFRHNRFQNNEKEKTLWDCFFGAGGGGGCGGESKGQLNSSDPRTGPVIAHFYAGLESYLGIIVVGEI